MAGGRPQVTRIIIKENIVGDTYSWYTMVKVHT